MSHDLLPDDLWVRRLQQRADEVTPDVDTDTGAVVRRGRRRRTTRRAATVVGTAVVAVVLALGAAPALRLVTHVQPAELPQDHEVVIDTSFGTITLPWDRYFLSETEQAEVLHASSLAMRACAADRGYTISDPVSGLFLTPLTSPNPVGDRRFGVWWLPSARQYGYGTWFEPSQRFGVSARLHDPARSDDQQAILDECGRTPTVQQLWPDTELSEEPPDFIQQALDSGAGQAVLAEWGACLDDHGMQREPEVGRWDVSDGSRLSGDTPVTSGEPLGALYAIADAQCKTDVDLVPRLAQLVADRQAPFIAAHRTELTTVRAALDDSLERARRYVDQHG